MKNVLHKIDWYLKRNRIFKMPNGFIIDNMTNKRKIRIYLAGNLLQEYNDSQYNRKLVRLYIEKYEPIKAEMN